MLTTYLKRGVTAGVVAGLAFGLLMALVANPLVAFADGLGHGGAHAHGADAGHDSAVSAMVTNAVSIVGGVLWGVLLGGVVFGVAYYFLEPAIPGGGATKSYLMAGAGFVTVSGAPWLVLPPQVPGVEQALPTDTRLSLYAGMMVVGAIACLTAGFAYRRLRGSRSQPVAAAGAALPALALLGVATALAPANAAESALPAELATGLTGLVVFGQLLLWALLAGVHARLRDATETSDVTATHTDRTVTAD
ncbi:CbtA family protein [Halarchaeum sp. P4]|uniref:CbtA family protein n=1 Tax=Halarchaeum sp. P4 TaxID=3421639 RepID=UPI003EB8CDD9